MVFTEFFKEAIILVVEQVVMTDTGTDENLFYPFQIAQAAKKFQIFIMIDNQIFTGLWEKALFVGANSLFDLLQAGFLSEVGCRGPPIS
jgi:hypothetical protein